LAWIKIAFDLLLPCARAANRRAAATPPMSVMKFGQVVIKLHLVSASQD
jgi:hypothetical protein